jgi:hypothetical protein
MATYLPRGLAGAVGLSAGRESGGGSENLAFLRASRTCGGKSAGSPVGRGGRRLQFAVIDGDLDLADRKHRLVIALLVQKYGKRRKLGIRRLERHDSARKWLAFVAHLTRDFDLAASSATHDKGQQPQTVSQLVARLGRVRAFWLPPKTWKLPA